MKHLATLAMLVIAGAANAAPEYYEFKITNIMV